MLALACTVFVYEPETEISTVERIYILMNILPQKMRRETTVLASYSPRIAMHVQGIARTDRRVMREASALAQAGFTVSIVDIEGQIGRPVTEEIEGVQIRHVVMPNWYISSRFPWSLFKAARMFMRSVFRLLGTAADVYHAHDVPALPAMYIVSRLRHKPLIFDAHELPLEDLPIAEMSINRRFIHPILCWVTAHILPRCASIIATSPQMAQIITARYHHTNVTVVRSFPPRRVITKSDQLRQHLGLGPEVRIALYQGNIQFDRQLDRLVRAATFLADNIVIVMMGKAEETTLTELKALIESEGVSERVKIIPPVPYAELLDWTASADIGLCLIPVNYTLHLQVCLPNKLFEYAMAGLPVLASNLEAISEVVNTYKLGTILPSLEPADIGTAINEMLADPDARNGLETPRPEFYWEKEQLHLLRVYQQVLQFPKVCMHVLNKARSDVRAMRAAKTLVEAGYMVSVVDIESEQGGKQPIEIIESVVVRHITVPASFIATRFKRKVLMRAAHMFILSSWQLLQTPADIYHALDLPALFACYVAARLRRKPLIFEAYELPLATLPVSELSASRRLLHRLLKPLLAYILPHCAKVITVSQPIVEEMSKQYHIHNVTLIRNVPEYRQVQKNDRLRQHLGLGPEVRIALYQGNIQPDRQLDRLVHAAAFLENDIVIVIMGRNFGTTQAQLEALIESEGVTERVRIIPPIPYNELLEWTASADVGLIIYAPDYSPNVQMMLPNKLFEYMMAGLPVLSSPLEAIVEVIDTYQVGQVLSSPAPPAIGEAINRILAAPAALASMRERALRATQEEYHWEKECLQLLSLYQNEGRKDERSCVE
jgi:glycosyltransferase involved in cell wall biosynthesis